jgi:predicted adenylyl cyclase CyaB
MLNFEIKTRIKNRRDILQRIRHMGAMFKNTMAQTDYYLQLGTNKKKIREIDGKNRMLISYRRAERKGRKDSEYTIQELSLKDKTLLLRQQPARCVIAKVRALWIFKHTRIHIDAVADLGNFLELETVVDGISKNEANSEFHEVMKSLDIQRKNAEPFSYSDLILLPH